MKNIYTFILGALAVFALDMVWASKGYAQDVKHCINLQTGDIIVVRAGYPCPSPTSEL